MCDNVYLKLREESIILFPDPVGLPRPDPKKKIDGAEFLIAMADVVSKRNVYISQGLHHNDPEKYPKRQEIVSESNSDVAELLESLLEEDEEDSVNPEEDKIVYCTSDTSNGYCKCARCSYVMEFMHSKVSGGKYCNVVDEQGLFNFEEEDIDDRGLIVDSNPELYIVVDVDCEDFSKYTPEEKEQIDKIWSRRHHYLNGDSVLIPRVTRQKILSPAEEVMKRGVVLPTSLTSKMVVPAKSTPNRTVPPVVGAKPEAKKSSISFSHSPYRGNANRGSARPTSSSRGKK